MVDDVVRSPGQPLPRHVRHDMEARLGHDFSRVRIHADAAASASATAIDAAAYTVDDHVVFGSGRWSPESSAGRRLLAHELAHVVQQSGSSGSVAEMSTPGDPWEAEADRVAASVTSASDAAAPAPRPGSAPALMREIISATSSPAGGGGAPPPLGGCKVFLGGRRIDHWLAGTLGFRHLYIDVYKSATDFALIEGGPVGSTTTGTSGAWVKNGNWDASGIQWDITPAANCPTFIDCLKTKTAVYHSAAHPYHYSSGPNSNSFVWWVLHECGLTITPMLSSYPYRGIDYWLSHSTAPAIAPSPAPVPP